MPQDYMDMSRGVGQLGVTAQRIGQMVAQQRFRQAVAQQQLMQQQREFEEVQRMNQFRQALMQAQAGSEGAQRRKYDQEVEDAQYQGGQRQALQQAIQSALGQKRRADTEEDLFGMETDPLNLDTVAAIQATLPNAQTPVQLMRNIAQGQAMQNPNLLNAIALGTRSQVMNVPPGNTPLNLATMQPGPQTPFKPSNLATTPLSQNAALSALMDPKFTILQPQPVQDLVNRTLGLTNAPATSGQGQPLDAPKDPAQRQPGAVYVTPRGLLKWTGTGWVQP